MLDATSWVLLAVAVLAVVAIVVLVVVLRRSRREHSARVDSMRAEHDVSAADAAREHEQRLAAAETRHGREVATVEQARADAQREAEDSRAFIAKSLRWDEASHDAILRVAGRLSLRGVLATNVVFVPAEAGRSDSFVAQVDHVLLTRHAAVVIENKNWKGLLFDGVLPSSVHAAFRGLFDETILQAPFAIQVRRESTTSWDVRTQIESDSPASQVRRQAQRLHGFVKAAGVSAPWFESCVFYSHPDATIYAEREDSSPGGAKTAIAAGVRDLEAHLRRFGERAPTTLTADRIDALAELFGAQGARVVRLEG